MMTRKVATTFLAALFAATLVASPAFADIIAGWNQNGNANALAADGFALTPASFPQANEHGPAAATHTVEDFDPETDVNGLYSWLDSFAGSTVNAREAAPAGGSFSFLGGPEVEEDVFNNNGAKSVFTVPTSGYSDILVSWSQRGTGTGFTSRVFEYSTDAGDNWTDIGAYTHTDATAANSGVLTSTFKLVELDLSAITGLNNNPDAMFRITYSGATSSTGNNRWDNFIVEGTVVPEPASMLLLSLGAIALVGFVRRK